MVNNVILVGNVGGDPELRSTSGGTSVVNLSLATTERWKDSDGNKQERTEWHRLFMFGKRAEAIAEYVKRGDRLYVEGSIRYNSYEDAEGITKYTTSIEINNFQFLSSNNDAATTNSAPQESRKATRGKPTPGGAKGGRPVSKSKKEANTGDDDLPL